MDPALAGRLLRLQREAYAVEAELIGDDRIPPLHESLDELSRRDVRWRVVLDGASPVAALALDDSGPELDVDRLVVAPSWARRGLGGDLVASVLAEAAASGREVVVSTARANAPASRLYASLGFRPTAHREVLPGLWVQVFRWRERRCARVVCRDAAGAVLLLRWRDQVDGRLVLEPPGGGLEPGEDPFDAARRELAEETGLPPSTVSGRAVAVSRDYRWEGRRHVGLESFFLGHVDALAPVARPAALTPGERASYAGHRWVPPPDLARLEGELQPPALLDVVRALDAESR